MSKTTWAFLSAVLILTACTNTNQAQLPEADFFVGPEQRFLLRVGDTAGIVTDTAIVLVRFGGVLADNRCPEGVECIQAGAATCLLTAQTTLAVQEVELDVPPDGGASVTVEEVTLQAEEVRPPAMEGVTIAPIDYEIVMSVAVTGDPLAPPTE